jgi:polysaccharide export outer membrane protein
MRNTSMKSRVKRGIASAMLLSAFALPGFSQKYHDTNSAASADIPQTKSAATPQPAVSPEYVIGSEDVLGISVWKEPDLSKSVPVRPDGKITVPLIGDVIASGVTAQQLQQNIEKMLGAYMDKPVVTVIVEQVKAQQYNLLGEVQRPGAYPLGKPVTLLDAIALGGGFRDFAKTNKIYILRSDGNGSTHRIPFNYKQVIKGQKFQQNVELLPGDTIVVP